jgi:hypothetical protein
MESQIIPPLLIPPVITMNPCSRQLLVSFARPSTAGCVHILIAASALRAKPLLPRKPKMHPFRMAP